MDNRTAKMQKRMLDIFQEEIQALTGDLMRDTFDPEKIMAFIRLRGFDTSKLPGMMSQQSGFDPYQILGLDRSVTDEEIKRRYIEVMNKVHPDKAGQEMTCIAAIVNTAYKIIKKERGME